VLVGPSTAVTPAPGARPLLDGEDVKAMISKVVSASLALGACAANDVAVFRSKVRAS
jgi:hypothetical protein